MAYTGFSAVVVWRTSVRVAVVMLLLVVAHAERGVRVHSFTKPSDTSFSHSSSWSTPQTDATSVLHYNIQPSSPVIVVTGQRQMLHCHVTIKQINTHQPQTIYPDHYPGDGQTLPDMINRDDKIGNGKSRHQDSNYDSLLQKTSEDNSGQQIDMYPDLVQGPTSGHDISIEDETAQRNRLIASSRREVTGLILDSSPSNDMGKNHHSSENAKLPFETDLLETYATDLNSHRKSYRSRRKRVRKHAQSPPYLPSGARERYSVKSDHEPGSAGVPANMRIEWKTRHGKVFNDSRRFVLMNGTLLITSVEQDDGGSYRCRLVAGERVLLSTATAISVAALGSWSFEPSSSTVTLGSGVRLTCFVPSSPPACLTWYRDHHRILPEERFFWPKPGILQIKAVTLSDTGRYWCSALNNVTNQTSNSSRGFLQVVDDKINWSKSDWFRRPDDYLNRNRHPIPTLRRHNLVNHRSNNVDDRYNQEMHNTRVNTLHSSDYALVEGHIDGGTIPLNDESHKLRTASRLSPDLFQEHDQPFTYSDNVVLDPLYENKLRLLPTSTKETVGIGSRVVLECMTESYGDSVRFSWTRNGSEIEPSRVKKVGQGSLVWDSVRPEDAGMYKCCLQSTTPNDAVNVQCDSFDDATHYNLEVQERPQIKNSRLSASIYNGNGVTLECRAVAALDLEIRWYRDGHRVCNGIQNAVVTSSEIGGEHLSTMRIANTTLNDQGIYQCFAVTKLGEVSDAGQIVMIPSPTVLPFPTNLQGSAISSTAVELSWNINKNNDTNIQENIYYVIFSAKLSESYDESTRINSCDDGTSMVSAEHEMATQRSHATVLNLEPYSRYRFYIRSIINITDNQQYFLSEPSNSTVVRTKPGVPTKNPDLTITKLSVSSLHVSWKKLSTSQASGLVVEQRIRWRRLLYPPELMVNNVTLDSNATSYNISDLKPTAEYEVVVDVATALGYSKMSTWTSVSMTYPNYRPVIQLAVVANYSDEMQVSVYLPYETSMVEIFKMEYNCSGQAMSYGLLPRYRNKPTIATFNARSCCTVVAVSVVKDSPPSQDHRATNKLCLKPATDTVNSDIELVHQIKAIPKQNMTSMQLSWSSERRHSYQYFAVYLQPLASVYSEAWQISDKSYPRVPWSFLVTDTVAVFQSLVPLHHYRTAVQLCTLDHCYLPEAHYEFTNLDTAATPPQNVQWSALSPSRAMIEWAPPAHSIHPLTGYLLRYSSKYSSREHRLNISISKYEMEQLISNTPYTVSIAGLADADEGRPVIFTVEITAYLQTQTTDWLIYVLVTIGVLVVALVFYFCVLKRMAQLTRLLPVFLYRDGPRNPPFPEQRWKSSRPCNGIPDRGVSGGAQDTSCQLDSKGPQLSPVSSRNVKSSIERPLQDSVTSMRSERAKKAGQANGSLKYTNNLPSSNAEEEMEAREKLLVLERQQDASGIIQNVNASPPKLSGKEKYGPELNGYVECNYLTPHARPAFDSQSVSDGWQVRKLNQENESVSSDKLHSVLLSDSLPCQRKPGVKTQSFSGVKLNDKKSEGCPKINGLHKTGSKRIDALKYNNLCQKTIPSSCAIEANSAC